jgi:Tol biopolymer transport system component
VGSGLASARPDGRPVFCNNPAALSADGRYAAFLVGEEVVTGVPSSTAIIAVRDMQTGQTTVASVASDGTTATNGFFGGFCSISADGRYVAFASTAGNLVPDKTSPWYDVFMHDRQTRETTRVSLAWDGLQGAGDSYNPSLSADGRFVAFESSAPNLVTGDSNNFKDVFVHDRRTGQTTRVSLADNGAQGNAGSGSPALSGDGRFVAFVSRASNLVNDDTNGQDDVFVHDRVGDTAPEVQAVPQSDGSLTIEWWDESVLYSTDRIGGSWTPDLEARSPFKVTPDAPQRFFRLQRPSAGGSPGR